MADARQPDPEPKVRGKAVRGAASGIAHMPDAAGSARHAYARHAWAEAYRSFKRADRAAPLGAEDLELLAISAYLLGDEAEYLSTVERAHLSYLASRASRRAAYCAFWIGLHLLMRGDKGQGTGWLARAQRLIDGETEECAESGYLLLPAVLQHMEARAWPAAEAAAVRATEIGERCREADLAAAGRHFQGRILMQRGEIDEGLALLDEAMVAVTTGELSPLATGLIYCSVIDGCRQVYALGRAREWTDALARWCERQPDLVAFTGKCMVHRAEIMQMNGAWQDAMTVAERVSHRFAHGRDRDAAAAAYYQQAELHRLHGAFADAERAYENASRLGLEPQPGLALLRMVQGRTAAASAAISRAVTSAQDGLQRTQLLPAYVEIMLSVGETEAARRAAAELESTAASLDTDVPSAMSAHARGSVALADGDAATALPLLHRAFEIWQAMEAPYLAARIRVEIARACRAVGDAEGARLALAAARGAFEELGAAPDLARLDVESASPPASVRRLSRRELQVLRLIAAGKTNKMIAAELFLSKKTVDRHVSNMFRKLDVPSRTAAAAYALQHQLI